MNYTEADVEREFAVAEGYAEGTGTVGVMAALRAIRFLKAAALEGAKVPGLVAWQDDVLHALAQAVDYEPKPADAVRIIRGMVTESEEAEQTEVDLRGEVSALQAQVADLDGDIRRVLQLLALGQQVDGTQTVVGHEAVNAVRRIVAERDALRAQVAEVRDRATEAEEARQALWAWSQQTVLEAEGLQGAGLAEFNKLSTALGKVFIALSAPPAETTPAPEHCGNCGEDEATHPTLCNEHDASDD